MLRDSQGWWVTTDSPAAIALLNRFIDQALGYHCDAEFTILQALAADPTCAIAQAYAAAYYLSQETAADRRRAAPYLQRALRYASQSTIREQNYITAIHAWSQRDIALAVAIHEAIANEFPTDLLSVQQGQYHYFYLGQQRRLLDIAERVMPANLDSHYLHGMVAFGLEQCGRLAEAEATAHRAIALNRQDPWAHHAIAHVFETQRRTDEGIAWMERHADTWEHCNSMLHTHNWWHIALYYLAKGDVQTVLRLYDERVWGRARVHSPKDQVGAIATLLRLELRGVDVGHRWQAIAPHLQARLHEHSLPFQDLHYIYALTRVGRSHWLSTMRQSITAHIRSLPAEHQWLWLQVFTPAAEGLIAHAQGKYETAIAHLTPILAHFWRLGGSHAQRALFSQIHQHAVQQVSMSFPRPKSFTHAVFG